MQLILDAGRYDPDRRAILGAAGEVSLTPTEAKLLEYLAERMGRVVSQKQLLVDVWGYSARVESRTLYTTVNRLRQKVEADPAHPRHLVSVQGAGYRLDAKAEDDATPAVAAAPAAPAPGSARTPRVEAPHGPSVGRERELAELASRIDDGAHVVTLVGPGGVGKTHLARRFAAGWDGAAWFVDVSEAATAGDVEGAVARALELPVGADGAGDRVGDALSGRGRALVVLDGFDRIVEAAPVTVGRWASRAGETRFLVTSREALQIAPEERVVVDPLGEQAAAALFVLRARAVRPELALDARTAEDVAAIVKALDGLPLALELAAARVTVLPPARLRERLAQGIDVLASSRRDLPERQRSLRAALDASWELLSPWERAALAQTSVFVGGMTLEAAEAVLDLDAFPDAPDALDVVQSLVDKSLVRFVPGDDVRFAMYEGVRLYADEKLGATGPGARAAAWRRHVIWAARMGQDASLLALHGPQGVERRRALVADLPNLLAAVDRALALGEGDRAGWAARAALAAMDARRPFAEGVALAERVLDAVPSMSKDARWRVRAALAHDLRRAGRPEQAVAVVRRSLAEDVREGDARAEGRLLCQLGAALRDLSDSDEGTEALMRACALLRAAGDEPGEADARGHLATVYWDRADMDAARDALFAELRLARAMGDRWRQAICTGNLAHLLVSMGQVDKARQNLEEALAMHREVGNRRFEGVVLAQLGALLHDLGESEAGKEHLRASLAIQRELGERRSEAHVTMYLGTAHMDDGELEEARRCYDASKLVIQELGQRRLEAALHVNYAELFLLQGQLDAAEGSARTGLEMALETHFPATEGAARGLLGEILGRRGRFEEAREQLDQAEDLLTEAKSTMRVSVVLLRRTVVERLAGALGAARVAIERAAELAAQVNAGPGSPLGREIARERAVLGD